MIPRLLKSDRIIIVNPSIIFFHKLHGYLVFLISKIFVD